MPANPLNRKPSRDTIHLLAHITGWCLVALIIYGSLTPSPVINETSINDKFQHGAAYFITMAWFAQLYGNSRRLLAQGLFLAALAVAMEFAQLLVPTRTFDILDMAAGATGVILAAVIPKTLLDRFLLTTGLISQPLRGTTQWSNS